jgi:hypothetical protein
MAGAGLTTASSLQCPHGGTVSIVSTNTQAQAGAPLVTQSDTFLVGGCPFVIGVVPSPCVKVIWIVPEMRVKIKGAAGLDASSVGLCIGASGAPQGPVVVQSTQTKVTGQ